MPYHITHLDYRSSVQKFGERMKLCSVYYISLVCGNMEEEWSQCIAVCCSVLQCIAGCCSVLQCVRIGRKNEASVSQCVAACCSVLQHVAACCSALQSVGIWGRMKPYPTYLFLTPSAYNAASSIRVLQHTATHGNTLQHTATHGNTLQLTSKHSNTLQHIHVLHILQRALSLIIASRLRDYVWGG